MKKDRTGEIRLCKQISHCADFPIAIRRYSYVFAEGDWSFPLILAYVIWSGSAKRSFSRDRSFSHRTFFPGRFYSSPRLFPSRGPVQNKLFDGITFILSAELVSSRSRRIWAGCEWVYQRRIQIRDVNSDYRRFCLRKPETQYLCSNGRGESTESYGLFNARVGLAIIMRKTRGKTLISAGNFPFGK